LKFLKKYAVMCCSEQDKKEEEMAAPYSVDLRKRVLAECDRNVLKRYEIAELFQVNLKTIYSWIETRITTGAIEPKSGYQKGHSHAITDTEKFKSFIADSPNLSLKELSEKWGGVSSSVIRNNLRKIGFTVKKNSGDIKSVTNKKGWILKKK
jgi:transposase